MSCRVDDVPGATIEQVAVQVSMESPAVRRRPYRGTKRPGAFR